MYVVGLNKHDRWDRMTMNMWFIYKANTPTIVRDIFLNESRVHLIISAWNVTASVVSTVLKLLRAPSLIFTCGPLPFFQPPPSSLFFFHPLYVYNLYQPTKEQGAGLHSTAECYWILLNHLNELFNALHAAQFNCKVLPTLVCNPELQLAFANWNFILNT